MEKKHLTVADVPTLVEIKSKLPAHCFKPDTGRSVAYLMRDLAAFAVLLAFSFASWTYLPTASLALVGPVLIFAQGTIMWALFVIGHDAGHGSFSTSRAVNMAAGLISHSILLVPYSAWQLTHRKHHKNTGHIDNDEIFTPIRQKAHVSSVDMFVSSAYFGGFSWFIYLFTGNEVSGKWAHHYWPAHFGDHAADVALSLFCVGVWTGLLVVAYAATSLATMIYTYFAPLLVFATWLVVTTFLHHNDDDGVPWFSGSKWNYVLGNLSSIDRSFGPLLDDITHNIATHQVHHLFPIIPHYHLVEATAAFRKQFAPLVRTSSAPIVPAFLRQTHSFARRRVIDDTTDSVVV